MEILSFFLSLRVYYEEKDRWQMQMEAQRESIYALEKLLVNSKSVYSEAMNALRCISDEVSTSLSSFNLIKF